MANDLKKALAEIAKAGGVTLVLLGSVSIIKEVHVLEQGAINFDSLIHTQLGGAPARTTVSDGGIDLACDPRWAINDFHRSFSTRIGSDLRLEKPPPGGEPAQPQLRAQVQKVADALRQEARSGDVLLVGSTDDKGYLGTERNNAGLALERAAQVQALLHAALPKDRNVLIANDRMTDGSLEGGGLARALFGAKESAGRSVVVCVAEPRPHAIQVTEGVAARGTPLAVTAGVIIGLGLAILLILVAPIVGREVLDRFKPPDPPP